MVTEAVRRSAAAVALCLVVGCSGGTEDSATPSENRAQAGVEVPPPAAHTEVPATSSGPLDGADLPTAEDLGAGWQPYADPGGHGYQGNGEYVRERDTREVALSLVPLGCAGIARAPGLPVPEHALEATFRGPGGAVAVALVLQYGDVAAATGFMDQLGGLLSSCPEPSGDVEARTTVVELLRPDPATIQDVRREVGPGASSGAWSEVVVRRGSRVGLTIVEAKQVDLDTLTARLRAAIE